MDKYNKYESENYIFNVIPDSLADNEINKIISFQEECFKKICITLSYKPNFKIIYYFFDNPISCGKTYNKNSDEEISMNAFCYPPNFVHATYSNSIKSIGHHEDAHLILFDKIKKYPNLFLFEGFSVYCDNSWRGVDLDKWVKYYFIFINSLDFENLVNSYEYLSDNCINSYPIAGSYCKWKIEKFGFELFYKDIINSNCSENYLITDFKYYKEYILNNIDIDNEINDLKFLIEGSC